MSLNSSRPARQRTLSSGETYLEYMEELHQSYYNSLLSYGYTITGQRQLVKDAIQDLFLWLLAACRRNP